MEQNPSPATVGASTGETAPAPPAIETTTPAPRNPFVVVQENAWSARPSLSVATVPPIVRRGYAIKVWMLLMLQYAGMAITSIPWIYVYVGSRYHTSVLGFFIFGAGCFWMTGSLHFIGNKFPVNYIVLALVIVFHGGFYGAINAWAETRMGLHITGMLAAMSLLCALFWLSGIGVAVHTKFVPRSGDAGFKQARGMWLASLAFGLPATILVVAADLFVTLSVMEETEVIVSAIAALGFGIAMQSCVAKGIYKCNTDNFMVALCEINGMAFMLTLVGCGIFLICCGGDGDGGEIGVGDAGDTSGAGQAEAMGEFQEVGGANGYAMQGAQAATLGADASGPPPANAADATIWRGDEAVV